MKLPNDRISFRIVGGIQTETLAKVRNGRRMYDCSLLPLLVSKIRRRLSFYQQWKPLDFYFRVHFAAPFRRPILLFICRFGFYSLMAMIFLAMF